MCGIAGLIAPSEVQPRVQMMTDLMLHRGPDDQGFFYESNEAQSFTLGLGHRRLSIRDLSKAAAQPMTDPSGRYRLIFNGELYNPDELKRDLAREGITQFRSTGDTELLLLCWKVWGIEAPKKFQGEFAFAIWDSEKKTLHLVRDRLGIKFIYYTQRGDEFAFSSEVRPLMRTGLTSNDIEPRAVDSYLAFGSVAEPFTLYRDVFVLPAGHILSVESPGLHTHLWPYWQNPFFTTEPSDELDIGQLGELAVDAVQSRLVSDVPLGIFLSGGIDSSSIVSGAVKNNKVRVKTFSLDFEDTAFSERQYAEAVAKKFKTEHQTILMTEALFREGLDKAFRAFDQPSLDGMNTYFVTEVARRAKVTVALSGLGGDEFFAGYPLFHRVGFLLSLQSIPSKVRALTKFLAPQLGRWSKYEKAAQLLTSPIDIYSLYGIKRSVFSESKRRHLLAEPSQVTPIRDWVRAKLPENIPNTDPVNLLSGLEMELYLRNTLLRDLDALSMANSLEVRGPFLDHRLVEKLARLGGKTKLSRKVNKPLLISTLGKDIPEECIHRPKQGFQFPFKTWLRGALGNHIAQSFSAENANRWRDLGLNPVAVSQTFDDFQNKRNAIQWSHIWTLYMLLRWRSN